MLRERLMSILYVRHLVDLAIEFAVTFPQNFEKVASLCFVVPLLCFKVFSDGRITVFIYALIEVLDREQCKSLKCSF